MATEEISHILRTRHRTELGADDFTVSPQEDFCPSGPLPMS